MVSQHYAATSHIYVILTGLISLAKFSVIYHLGFINLMKNLGESLDRLILRKSLKTNVYVGSIK